MKSRKSVQKQTGSFYTPATLASRLACEVLDAWQATRPKTCWSKLTVLDPAAGTGGLLIPFALELCKRRHIQEPHVSQTALLKDIFTRQLFAADISKTALNQLPINSSHCLCTDALAEKDGRSVLFQLTKGKVDVVIANPPYIGQKDHAAIFNQLRKNILWKNYVMPKGDLMYFFFYLALHLLKPEGIAGFITTPYFSTAAGAAHLRQILRQQSTFLRLINFEEKRLFKEANLHTLVSVFQKGNKELVCLMGDKTPVPMAQHSLFYGPDHFLHTQPTGPQDTLLHRMANAPHILSDIAHVSNGLMTGCDKAFILTDSQKNAMALTKTELAKLKPFFKNSDIRAYVPNTKARLWLIDFFYPNDRDMHVADYPHLLIHLEQFKTTLLARRQNNNGIDKQLARGHFWFGSVRRKLNFETEKIVLPHRARKVCAAYTQTPWYASSDVYFITKPRTPYTLWTILGLLNSAPYLTWLQSNGKRKGKLLELYSAPLKQLPIPVLTPEKQAKLEKLTRSIYDKTQTGGTDNVLKLQKQLDKLVVSCF